MKYKLINIKTKEEHLCDKVTIDGFDYYTEDGNVVKPVNFSKYQYQKGNGIFKGMDNMKQGEVYEVIATNNPNIDVPKVVDEIEIWINKTTYTIRDEHTDRTAKMCLKAGYNKSQETHPFSEEDVRFMLSESFKASQEGYQITSDEIIQLWKEQKIKTLYYE